MKKFYAIALMGLATLGLSAAPLQPKQLGEKKSKKSENAAMVAKKAGHIEAKSGLAAKAPAKIAATVADVIGNYDVSYTVELEDAPDYAGEMVVSQGTKDNQLVFEFPFESGGLLTWNVFGTLNPDNGEITFKLADQSFENAKCTFERWTNGDWANVSEIVATFTGEAIEFDEDDAMGLKTTSGDGYYTFFDMIVMDKIIDDPNADPNEGWTSVGNAKFLDPWVMTAFNTENVEYEVELQQNDLDKDLYRLVDPYKGNFPMVKYNESTAKHGYIQFNVSDPDHVYFDVVECGFANSELGISKMYCYNSLTWASLYLGVEPASVVELMGDEFTYTTFKDGVVTLGAGEYVDEETGKTELEYDACFGVQGQKDGGLGWQDSDGSAAPMLGYIAFPSNGISAVAGDNAQAEAVYYDLFGRRVNGAVEGQIVIRKQGSSVVKILK